jgi:hypothetical protein
MSERRAGRVILVNTALVVGSLIVSVILAEILLQAFAGDKINIFPRYHTHAQYNDFTIRRTRPNTVFWHASVDGRWRFTINSQGFRNDRDFSYHKPRGMLRVLSLGDSHTQGYEVDQEKTFSVVTERYLQGEGLQAEVINTGVSGFSTAEELVFLENEGMKYKPDIVVLGFYANDFDDNVKAGLFSIKDGELFIAKKRHIPGVAILNTINDFSLFRWLSENSYLYSFGLNSAWNLGKQLLLARAKANLKTEYAIPVHEIDRYQMILMEHLIERMYTFCRRNNIKLVILDIPKVAVPGQVKSSVPEELLDVFQRNSDHLVYSKEILKDYRNVASFHLPHGHRHISEFTHLVYGVEVAKYIQATHTESIAFTGAK